MTIKKRTCSLSALSVFPQDKFLQRLEIFCEEGHPAIPDTEILNIILRSRWGYSLETLVNGYCDLYYPQDCDDSSSVAEILDSIKISLP